MLVLILIAISLSMDAFSLSLAYGTFKIKKNQQLLLALIVGIYHFFMPLFGMILGHIILDILPISSNIIIFVILFLIGFQMIYESFKTRKVKKLTLVEMFLFGLAVSIDSFSIGIGLNNLTNNTILAACLFSVSSFAFTYLGLKIGNKITIFLGKISPIIGGTILIAISIYYII